MKIDGWVFLTWWGLKKELQSHYEQRIKYDAPTKWVQKGIFWALMIPQAERSISNHLLKEAMAKA